MIYEALATVLPTVPQKYTTWQPGHSPLSTDGIVIGAVAGYLAILWAGQKFLEDRKALTLRPAFILHNALLSIGSGLLLALMAEEIVPIVYRHGFFYGICHIAAWTPRLEMYYMINYYFKYWEFVDTFFLVAKKKKLEFLHVFHHSATALLCYTQLNGRTSVSWVVITANLLVHTIMYLYYFQTAAFPGIKIWWKKYLTSLQISQFVLDLFIVYFASYSYFATEYFPNAPTVGTCSGSEFAAVFGCGLLTSYLLLFIAFYKRTYKPSSKVANGAPARIANGKKVA